MDTSVRISNSDGLEFLIRHVYIKRFSTSSQLKIAVDMYFLISHNRFSLGIYWWIESTYSRIMMILVQKYKVFSFISHLTV